MLVLRSSTSSPFARKIRIAIAMLDLADQVRVESTDTLDPNDSVRKQNPLGKIPTLILEDGSTVFDSPVILKYLDDKAGGGRIIPKAGAAHFDALRMEALADGILDAGILRVYEGRFRPAEKHEPKWLDHQTGKIDRAMAAFEKAPPAFGSMIHVGHITLACALGYLDFRFNGDWRKTHPKLVQWLDEFAKKVPAFAETKPQ
ncbi:MAG TPA: glutathione S-transferase family protein [Xanthobacteraceae bacterium]|nr:glutathione S-transferase family protein [Xanthobacteraceae bacterium]